MKRQLAVAVVLVTVLSAALVVPAFGGPSVRTAYKTARKALKLGKKADKRAKRGPLVIERAAKDIPAPPLDFARFDIKCPSGYTAVGIGLGLGPLDPVFFASYGGGALGSMFNPSDTTVYTGDAYVECVKSAGFVGAATVKRVASRRQALGDRSQAEEQTASSVSK